MKNKIILILYSLGMLLFLLSCFDGYELVDVEDKFKSNIEYKLVDETTSSFPIKTLIDDNSNNPVMNNFSSISFFPKKEIEHAYFSAMGWTIYTNGYYGNCIIKIFIVDDVIEYEEKDVVKTIDGVQQTVKELVEVNRYKEVIYLTAEQGDKINVQGDVGVAYGVDLDYQIKGYSSSTSFTFVLYQEDGFTPVNFYWGLDNFEVVVILDYE